MARLSDVTMATLRHIFVSKGFKKIVPILGFFEVLLWLLAMKQVFSHLDNFACFLAWAAGFSAGTYFGMYIEERLALGNQIIRIISNEDISLLVDSFKNNHQGVTIVDGQGAIGPVKLIFTIVKRTRIKEVVKLINKHTPNAFYSIEDVKGTEHGVFASEGNSTPLKRLFAIQSQK